VEYIGQENILPHIHAALRRAREINSAFGGFGQEMADDFRQTSLRAAPVWWGRRFASDRHSPLATPRVNQADPCPFDVDALSPFFARSLLSPEERTRIPPQSKQQHNLK